MEFNYFIRRSKHIDIPKLNHMLTELIHDEKQYDKNINEKCVVNFFYERFINDYNSCILVAESNNEVIGYLYGVILNNGDAYIENIARIDALFIEEGYRGKGIGKELITEFKKWVKTKNINNIEISVYKNNTNAIKLYEKEGFNTLKYIMTMNIEK